MKRIIPTLVYLPLLLLMCHQLLFMVLNFASLTMTSDSDINLAGTRFLMLFPVIAIPGLWAVHHLSSSQQNGLRHRHWVILTLALHGGLWGAIATNGLMHVFRFDFEDQTRWATFIATSFIGTTPLAAIGLHSAIFRHKSQTV